MFSRFFKSVALTISFILVFQPIATSAALAVEESSIIASTEQSSQTVQADLSEATTTTSVEIPSIPEATTALPSPDGSPPPESQNESVLESQTISDQNGFIPVVDFMDAPIEGIGFKFSSGSHFIDFRSLDFPAINYMSLGNKIIFSPDSDTSIIYTLLNKKIKEEIILSRKPSRNSFSFSLSKSDLNLVKKDDGYHFTDFLKQDIFFIPNPVVVDAKGIKGSAALEINGEIASLVVDQAFLDKASYPVNIDPTVIATSSSTYATALNSQRKTFFDGNRYWAFYSDGTDIVYRSSVDGTSWSSPTPLTGGSAGHMFSVWYDNQKVYVALANGYSIDAVQGTISGSAISWGDQTNAFQGSGSSDYYSFPMIAKDSTGKLWLGANHSNGTNYWVKAIRSSNADSVAGWDSSSAIDLSSTTNTSVYTFPSFLPLTGGKTYAYWLRGTAVEGRLFNGSTWDSLTSLGTSFIFEYVGAVPSAVAKSDGTIYLAYTKSTSPNNVVYKTGISPYGSSDWSAETDLAVDGNFFPSLSYDEQTSRVYAYYAQWKGDNQYRLRHKRLGSSVSDQVSSSFERTFDSVYAYSGAYSSYTDVTSAAADMNAGDVKHSDTGKMLSAPGDYFYVGMNEKYDSVFFDLGTTAQGLNLIAFYWNGSTWSNLSISDNTSNLSVTERDVTFTPPADWALNTGYYYLLLTTSSTPTVAPIGDQVTAYKTNLFTSANYSRLGRPLYDLYRGHQFTLSG